MTNYIEFEEVEVVAVSSKGNAVMLRIDGEDEWIPFSQIEDNGEDFKVGNTFPKIYLTQWICEQKGL